MTPETGKAPTFEEALEQLEEIVRSLEAGDISLEESLAKYESGVGLLKGCYALLRQAEQRILLLTGEDAEGKPITQPFEHTSSAEPPTTLDIRRKPRKPDSSY
jgi:exodeoxyribonuclease VII small subunit